MREDLNSKYCKGIWCKKIFIDKVNYVIVGVCYHSQVADEHEISQLFDCINSACNMNHLILIVGDFNYPDINWLSLTANKRNKFLKLILDSCLEQQVAGGSNWSRVAEPPGPPHFNHSDLLGVSRSSERDLLSVLFLFVCLLCIVAFFIFVLFCYNLMHVHCFGLIVNTCPPLPFGRICFVVLVMRKGGKSS